MLQITIPIGTEINQTNNKNSIQLKIPNSKFWIIGEKNKSLWKAYLFDPKTYRKDEIRRDITTKSFALFANIILKTPFPEIGKRASNIIIIKKFIKKITKKSNGKHNNKRISK